MAWKTGPQATEALAGFLAAGLSQVDAATRAGVSTRTVARRLADPAFRRRVQELRAEMLARTSGLLADSGAEAVEALRELLKGESPQARLGAARAILENLIRVRDATEVEERLAAIEERLAQAEAGSGELALTKGGKPKW